MKAFRFLFFVVTVSVSVVTNVTAQVTEYESSVTLNASEFVAASILRGPNHTVDETVTNDGFLNAYTINSRYGTLKAISTAKMIKYVNELEAVARMEHVERSDAFAGAVKNSAGKVVQGSKDLVNDPVGSVSGAISGVGTMFKRAGSSLSDGRSDGEDGSLRTLTGFSRTKRQYAYEFGVDAYSRNEILQKQLDSLARAGAIGNVTASAALMMVPGGAGVAVSVTKNTRAMNELMRETPPPELRIMNRSKLARMRINENLIDLFIRNGIFTPREQTSIVSALESMGSTRNREEFIKFSIPVEDADLAFYRSRQAQLYANYSNTMESLDRFVTVAGNITTARTASGKIVFTAPLDYLLWSRDMAAVVSMITQEINAMKDIREKELWVTGNLSPVARTSISNMGWSVHENAEGKLIQ